MMKTFKKIIKFFLYPYSVIMAVLLPVSVVLLAYSFLGTNQNDIAVYVSYGLSAYTLTVYCVRIPNIVSFVKKVKEENKYVNRLMTDAHLKVKLSLYGSFAFNAAYEVFQLGLGRYHSSVWFYSLAVYYILLAVMRFFLLRNVRAYAPGENMRLEWQRYRFCGMVLLIMNLALAVIVFYITWQNRGFEHHPITTIAMAAYTFTAFTVAIVNLVKYRKYKSPVFSAAKAISLASAAVSMLTLETAMFTAFGEGETEDFRMMMTGATGVCVCIFVLVMAVYMIVRSSREIKKSK